jgi:transposase
LALGDRPAASFAKRLTLPVSSDTVLRVVRAQACPRTEPLNVVGIDDWVFRRHRSDGTNFCDLERRRVVTLLPDRETATVEPWLAGHPDIGFYPAIVVAALACQDYRTLFYPPGSFHYYRTLLSVEKNNSIASPILAC